MHKRLSSAEKGKGLALTSQEEAPRKARVRVTTETPDNSARFRQLNLTLIGKVTNPSVQKVWTLIPFFTDLWKTERRPVGSDLGQGLFQFQFEEEADLLGVLEKRPYHFAKWMIILQRWEPTISPSFPSLIPFWIKVQGVPLHLWTEATIKSIGEDIGMFESLEITSLAIRMRVHVNGRLPLIKSSVIEYDNGDEVIATLVYERLEKHYSQCNRLDHELKDCLEAKALKKARALAAPELSTGSYYKEDRSREMTAHSLQQTPRNSGNYRPKETYQNRRDLRYEVLDRRHQRLTENRSISRNLSYKRQEWQPKSANSLRNLGREDSRDRRDTHSASNRLRVEPEPANHTITRSTIKFTNLQVRYGPPLCSPLCPTRTDTRHGEGSSSPKNNQNQTARGTPLRLAPPNLHDEFLPKEAMEEALGEL